MENKGLLTAYCPDCVTAMKGTHNTALCCPKCAAVFIPEHRVESMQDVPAAHWAKQDWIVIGGIKFKKA